MLSLSEWSVWFLSCWFRSCWPSREPNPPAWSVRPTCLRSARPCSSTPTTMKPPCPAPAGRRRLWGAVANWAGLNRQMAYGLAADGVGGKATISASLFLLVKYYQAPTRLFVCPSDKGTSEFKLDNVGPLCHPLVWRTCGISDRWPCCTSPPASRTTCPTAPTP